MSELHIERLIVELDGNLILDKINLKLQQGEIGVILGKSGVGKTTLLKVIAGMIQPTGGSANWREKRIKGPEETLIPGQPDVKLVAQDLELMPVLSAKENIIQGMPRRQEATQNRKANELLRAFKLSEFAKKKVKYLSGGQQQRVALAKALAANASLLLFDETFSQLDLSTKMAVMIDLKLYLKSKKKTALFVLHNALDTFFLADQLFILQKKKLIQKGTPKEVLAKPVNIDVAQLFGHVNVVSKYVAKTYFPKVKVSISDKTAWFRPSGINRNQIIKEYQIIDKFQTEKSNMYIVNVGKSTIWIEEPFMSAASQS